MNHEQSPIRVAHFYSSLGIYGAERWVVTLLKYLDRRRVSSIVVTVGSKPGARLLHDLVIKEGHKAVHIDVPGKLNPRAVRQLRTFLQDEKIEILHTHGFKSDVIGYFATRGLPVKLVSTLHGWSVVEGARIGVYEAIGRFFLRRFDRLYPLSPALLEDLQTRGFDAGRMRLILNAVDIGAFDWCYQNRRYRSAGEPLRILFAGRLCKPKGVSFLIQAMAKATFSCDAKLQIVGDGPDRGELERLTNDLKLGDKVQFMGVAKNIGPFLAESDVLALPSFCEGVRCEGIPRIIMESFSAGVPVIGSSIPGIRELIDDRNTGLLFPVGDADKLARALEVMAEEPDVAREMAMRARMRVESTFSAIRLARELEEEYEELAQSSGAFIPIVKVG